jgi:hypothetical protein
MFDIFSRLYEIYFCGSNIVFKICSTFIPQYNQSWSTNFHDLKVVFKYVLHTAKKTLRFYITKTVY